MKKVGFLILIAASFIAYLLLFADNLQKQKSRISFNIPTGSTYQDVLKILDKEEALVHPMLFDLMAKIKGYPSQVKAGHYILNVKMSNRELVNMLQNGLQTKVRLNPYNVRTIDEYAKIVSSTLEIDENKFMETVKGNEFLKKNNLTEEKVIAHFLYQVFELNWNTSLPAFVDTMDKRYIDFWNNDRLQKAAQIGLKPSDVITLASIVEKECVFDKELSTIAGVYLNRLKIDMPLQADPTLVFAAKDFDAQRVTNYHKEIESPYNTYRNTGLPPGPICLPRLKSIEAVLNPEKHEFIYFCANPDMSGYSIFSKTLDEQNSVAKLYRQKLNEMNIH